MVVKRSYPICIYLILLSCITTGFTKQETVVTKLDHFVISTVQAPPFVMHVKSQDDIDEKFMGFIPDLMSEVAQDAQFTFTFKLADDGKYGDIQFHGEEDHEWTGLIGEVTKMVADIAAAPLTVTEARLTAVDFTIPWFNLSHTALVRKDTNITNLQDLILEGSLTKYGTIAGSFTAQRLEETPDMPFARMWARIASEGLLVQNTEEGLERMRTENYALILETPTAEYLSKYYSCDLKTIEPFMNGFKYAFAVPKNSTLKLRLDKALKRILDSGRIVQLYNKWWSTKKGNCDPPQEYRKIQVDETGFTQFNRGNGLHYTFSLEIIIIIVFSPFLYNW